MASFTDSTGEEWQLHIDIPTARRVKRETGVDIVNVSKPAFSDLGDILTLVDVLSVILTPQIEEAGLTEHDFACRLAGDAIEDAANALIAAIIEFFPSRQRDLLTRVSERAEAMRTQAELMATEELSRLTHGA